MSWKVTMQMAPRILPTSTPLLAKNYFPKVTHATIFSMNLDAQTSQIPSNTMFKVSLATYPPTNSIKTKITGDSSLAIVMSSSHTQNSTAPAQISPSRLKT